MGEAIVRDKRGGAITLYISREAIEFLDSLVKEQAIIPKPGRGRFVEDLLLKEKARREKKKPAESQPAA